MASHSTLTRASRIKRLTQDVSLSPQNATVFLEAVLENMSLALIAQGQVKISGFGSFTVRQKEKRMGRNPKTKEEALITPRRVVSFTASSFLKKKIAKKSPKGM